jgi:hypothetical protein
VRSAQPQQRRMRQHKTEVSPHLTLWQSRNTSGIVTLLHCFERQKPIASDTMGKPEMYILNLERSTPSRFHPIVTALLLLLCLPIFIYQLAPTFTHATDDFMSALAMRLRGQTSRADFCTKEVGSAYCCGLFLDASPCVDECQKQHVDRIAFVLTKEYDECADICLAHYNASCPKADNGDAF